MTRPNFVFEPAPHLPGSERVSRYGLGAIRSVMTKLWNLQIEGAENIPRSGPAIIAANHLSFCDSVFLPAALPRRIWTIGKSEYMDDWKTKHLFPAFGMIPVDRSGGKKAIAALDTAARILDNGHLFLIYPEGTRSRSGNLHRGRTGAARLAFRCNAPIIPVGHTGTLNVQPPGQVLMRPFNTVTVQFGKPMHATDFGDPTDPRSRRALTDAVMYQISKLSGQSYVHTYATGERPSTVETSAAGSSPSLPAKPTPTKPTPTKPTPTKPTPTKPLARPTAPAAT